MRRRNPHSEWLNLLEISGPFLSLTVLHGAFPNGLDALESGLIRRVQEAYEEWEETGYRAGIHNAWVRFLLRDLLEYSEEFLLSGQDLLAAISFEDPIHHERIVPSILIADPEEPERPRLPVLVVPRGQKLEAPLAGARSTASPQTRMQLLLQASGLQAGFVTNGAEWTLVHVRKGEPTGFATWQLVLLGEERATLEAFRSLLGSKRIYGVAPKQNLLALLDKSATDHEEVTRELGRQVRQAVEVFLNALERLDRNSDRRLLAGVEPKQVYDAALTVMMRLVFLLCAEQTGLLPKGDLYDRNYAVSTLNDQLREAAGQGEEALESRCDAWLRLLATFRLIHAGCLHEDLKLPAYGGSLFDPDRYPFLEGAAEAGSERQPLQINNRVALHLLDALEYLEMKAVGGGRERRRLSFRALGVEEIGHVYEGLLDHTAAKAEAPTLGLIGKETDEPEVALATLEAKAALGEDELTSYLVEQTGKSAGALRTLRQAPLDAHREAKLLPACGGDAALVERVRPFLNLVRDDSLHHPQIYPAGSLFMTRGADRRSTGTHYTPESLTREIVKHTLEPLVYDGPAEGKPESEWRLRPASELLALKICDPAMGSGAFLVQACRYLSERLVEAWALAEGAAAFTTEGTEATEKSSEVSTAEFAETAEESQRGIEGVGPVESGSAAEGRQGFKPLATPTKSVETDSRAEQVRFPELDFSVSSVTSVVSSPNALYLTPAGELTEVATPPNRVLPSEAAERLAVARRIVADHCLYGVDKNPMAVEMAKLSVWLLTLARDKPFTFLDHRLKHGDSLVGTIWWETNSGKLRALPPDIPDAALRSRELREQNARERGGQLGTQGAAPLEPDHATEYRKLADFPDDPEGQQQKEAFYKRLVGDAVARRRRTMADLWAAAWFWPSDPQLAAHTPTTALYRAVERGQSPPPEVTAEIERLRERIPFFHWGLAFPDVLERGGFDAVVANPPFQGGQKITGALGLDYRDYLVSALAGGQRGSADLCAYFYLQAGRLLRRGGVFGMLATNSIAQGDTREVGLQQIVGDGHVLIRATPSLPWPGDAALEVAIVWLFRGPWTGTYTLNGDRVRRITVLLGSEQDEDGTPMRLVRNASRAFQGSVPLGMGFFLDPTKAQALIQEDGRNGDVLRPCLNGEDLNSSRDRAPSASPR